jgi:hypothetical protein
LHWLQKIIKPLIIKIFSKKPPSCLEISRYSLSIAFSKQQEITSENTEFPINARRITNSCLGYIPLIPIIQEPMAPKNFAIEKPTKFDN